MKIDSRRELLILETVAKELAEMLAENRLGFWESIDDCPEQRAEISRDADSILKGARSRAEKAHP